MRKICVVCRTEFDARGRSKCCSETCSSERRREYYAKYREENRERRRECDAKYREENRERRREYDAKYREEHRENAVKYREENRERLRECEAKYREENRERRRELSVQLYRTKCLMINTLKARGEEL